MFELSVRDLFARVAILPGAMHPFPNDEINRIACELEAFEASESRARTGTGSRREGAQFEKLAATMWHEVASYLTQRANMMELVRGPRSRCWARISTANRSVYVPTTQVDGCAGEAPIGWLDIDFGVPDMIDRFPGTPEAIARYAPQTGPFAGPEYPSMFSRMKTQFDDTIVFEENEILCEKILLEYKTAKSSTGRQIDGNAHERLSFQIMHYLEVATRYPSCSMAVLTNGAFARYRNKYHVSFHVQADRLAAFKWFSLTHSCTVSEYASLVDRVCSWLDGRE